MSIKINPAFFYEKPLPPPPQPAKETAKNNYAAKSLLDLLWKVSFDEQTRKSIQNPALGNLNLLVQKYGFDVTHPTVAQAILDADTAAWDWDQVFLEKGVGDPAAEKRYQVAMGAIMAALYEEMMSDLYSVIW
jgi:hypothetical protein